jgi:hypothetical protein
MKLLLLAVSMAIAAAAQTYVVAGVVTDVAHGKPLERARVTLSGKPAGKNAAITGPDGRFLFDVPQGKYSLLAEHNGWRVAFGHPEPSTGFGSAIIAGPDQDTAHLALRWYAPGAICGRVSDEQGEPVREAAVHVIRDGVIAGRRRIVSVGTAYTDDRGEYRLGPLPAGAYYIAAIARPLNEFGFAPGTSHQPVSSYPPTYYPGAADSRDAAKVTVPSGGEVRADIPLRTATGATVRFRCPGSGRKGDVCPMVALSLQSVGGVELPTPAAYDYETGSFSGVAPGRYAVHVTTPGKTADRVIDVRAGEFSFDLNLQPPTPVDGMVTFQNPLPEHATVYVGMTSDTTGASYGHAVGPGGAFTSRLAGGRFRLRLYGSVPLFIAQVSAEGAAVKDGLLDLTESTSVRLKILASDELGRLKGFAMQGEHPAPAVMVVLAPATPANDPAEYTAYQTESDGSFDWPYISVGDYLLFAVDRLDLEYTNPEAIRPYLPAAIPVHIPAHGTVEQRVMVTARTGN